MENVFEINSDFDFNKILLDNPTALTGGAYFTKLLVNNGTKNMYLQLPKVTTKQGFIKNNNKNYCDLMFPSTNKDLIKWFEEFEKKCQELIFNKKDLWFHNEITKDDIEEMMNPIIRSYKSGKYFLIRVYIKNDKCIAFDEDKKIIQYDTLTPEDEIISIINLDGIKFTSRTIQLEINLTQYMQLLPIKEFEQQFLIKLDKKKINAKNLEEIKQETEQEIKEETKQKTKEETEEVTKEETEEVTEEVTKKETEEVTKEEILYENNNINNLEKDSNDLKDISLDIISSLDNNDIISLKDPLEVYKEIYLVAKKKAFELRKNALEAYLEAENIKNKYSLENMEESDDENDFVDLFKNNL